jgi:hypothetical protein
MKTKTYDYMTPFMGIAEIVSDFPTYHFKRSQFGASFADITLEKPKKRTFFPVLLDEPKPEIEIQLGLYSHTEDKNATLKVQAKYNKTLVKSITDYLEAQNFEVTLEMQT